MWVVNVENVVWLHLIMFNSSDKYGKRAGFIRNCEMVDCCDGVVVFWDGKSKGTKHTIDYASKRGKPCIIVNI